MNIPRQYNWLLLYGRTGPGWKEAFWLVPWAVRILLCGPLRWTTHEVISLICVLEKIWKANILALSRNLFPCQTTRALLSDQTFWYKFCKNGVIKTNFCLLIVARAFHRSNVLCRQEIQNRTMIIEKFIELACSVRTGKILAEFSFFASLRTCKKRTWPIFSQYGPHVSSITYIYWWYHSILTIFIGVSPLENICRIQKKKFRQQSINTAIKFAWLS